MYGLLSDMTVVEGASFIAGPSCALHLRQMGARVIRFDQIGGGLDYHRWPLADSGDSLYWEGLNKGKESIALNLRSDEGRELAQRLATAADGLFVTNFPATGFLSYESLSKLRSDLLCARIMGWSDGTQAVDYTINAAVGIPAMTGPKDDPRPVNHVLPAWDLLAGAYASFALLAAERERRQSRTGREIRVALSDLAAATMGHLGSLAEVGLHGDRPRFGNDLFGAFGRDFASADGVSLMIVAITERQWSGLVTALGIQQAVDIFEASVNADFSQEGARFQHRDTLNMIVGDAIGRHDGATLESRFAANGVCWSRYRSLAEALEQEPRLFRENPIFESIVHPSGEYLTPGAAALMQPGTRHPAEPAPRIGQDTDAILSGLLGLGDGEIAGLHDRGVVA